MKHSLYIISFISISLLFSAQSNLIKGKKHESRLSKLETHMKEEGLINVRYLDPLIRVDLKYATTDNFTKVILYDTLTNAYLHPLAAKKIVKAQQYLKQLDSNLCLLIYDAARPLSIQKKMFKVVQGTPQVPYVANPTRTGLHNYGMAVDLTICNKNGIPLDMGTPFDYFGSAAGINKEAELIKQGRLTTRQVKNQTLLRKVMVYAGFQTIRGEWWHFNAISLTEARESYKVIESQCISRGVSFFIQVHKLK